MVGGWERAWVMMERLVLVGKPVVGSVAGHDGWGGGIGPKKR